eukprot:sb/3472955/
MAANLLVRVSRIYFICNLYVIKISFSNQIKSLKTSNIFQLSGKMSDPYLVTPHLFVFLLPAVRMNKTALKCIAYYFFCNKIYVLFIRTAGRRKTNFIHCYAANKQSTDHYSLLVTAPTVHRVVHHVKNAVHVVDHVVHHTVIIIIINKCLISRFIAYW